MNPIGWPYRSLLPALALALGMSAGAQAQHHSHETAEGAYPAPPALETEHQRIHEDLVALLDVGGATGEAANHLAEALHAHFAREQEIAVPPLGLLAPIAAGTWTPEMAKQAQAGSTLKEELPKMLEEHGRILAAANALRDAGVKEGRPDAVEFADELILHAQTEEQVLYPAAIVVAEYARLRSGS